MKILINAPFADEHIATLRRILPQLELAFVPPEAAPVAGDLADVDVLYTNSADFDASAAPQLKLVQLNTAAANMAMDKPVWRSQIPLATVSGAYTTAVAECAWAMLLALTRRIQNACRMQSERSSDTDLVQGEELYGRTLGIVGYGSIGRHIARIAQAFGMRVLACKRDPQNRHDSHYALPNAGDPLGLIPAAWFGIEQLQEMLPQCDVVIVTLPLTGTTGGLIDRRAFEAMPRHAYFMNIGRGPVVNEDDLIAALQEGLIKGAALDVTTIEPLPDESPLWDMPNVLLLPHVASWTDKQAYRAGEVLIANVQRLLNREIPYNLVSRKNMY
jgi:phosphoglycerate dehydrogenase-like enzyme